MCKIVIHTIVPILKGTIFVVWQFQTFVLLANIQGSLRKLNLMVRAICKNIHLENMALNNNYVYKERRIDGFTE